MFIAFGELGEEIERSAAARRIKGAAEAVRIFYALREYSGLALPGDASPSIDHLTPDEQAFLASIGFELPPPNIEEVLPVYDASFAAVVRIMEAVGWRAALSSRLGLNENTAQELERHVPSGTCTADEAGEFCMAPEGELGWCWMETCNEYQP